MVVRKGDLICGEVMLMNQIQHKKCERKANTKTTHKILMRELSY